eukprot:sb/3473407/
MLALLMVTLLTTNGVLADWTPVEHDQIIPLDLSVKSLKVLTNSSYGRVRWMTGPEKSPNAAKMMIFLRPRGMKYIIEGCTFPPQRFPVAPVIPADNVLVWEFIKTDTSLEVYCNDEGTEALAMTTELKRWNTIYVTGTDRIRKYWPLNNEF